VRTSPTNLSMRLDFSDCCFFVFVFFLVKLLDESCFCVERFSTGECIYRVVWTLSCMVSLKQGRLPKSWILGCHWKSTAFTNCYHSVTGWDGREPFVCEVACGQALTLLRWLLLCLPTIQSVTSRWNTVVPGVVITPLFWCLKSIKLKYQI